MATNRTLSRMIGDATTVGKALLLAASAAAARTTLELGALALKATINNADWSGTDLAVANGGTGASDAATARTNLGLGTTDSPEFTAVNIGAAADTTVARASAGNLSIEGNIVYRAGGTDVPVADGGTGRSSHTAYAVLCGGTTTTDAQQSIAAVGTTGQVLTSAGAGALPTFENAPSAAYTRATEIATTSGTAHGFTGIPAGVSEIVVSFAGVSLSGTDHLLVQLGDAGGVEVTGYVSGSTAGLQMNLGNAAWSSDGAMVLYRQDGNKWRAVFGGWVTGGGLALSGGGTKALSAELTQLRFTVTGANTFDAGAVNIMYR